MKGKWRQNYQVTKAEWYLDPAAGAETFAFASSRDLSLSLIPEMTKNLPLGWEEAKEEI